MTNHFNLALFPDDEQLMRACIDLAQANFADQASEYLLGEQAWPHITLCQFEAEVEKLSTIWTAVEDLQVPEVNFRHIYVMPGLQLHEGKYWVGLAVDQTRALLDLQKTVYRNLKDCQIQSTTDPESYFPHLTWARCHGNKPVYITSLPPKELWQDRHLFSLSLGRSDRNGVYQERLYPLRNSKEAIQ